VRVSRLVTVLIGLAELLFVLAAVRVSGRLGRFVLLGQLLGEGAIVPRLVRVEVVVLVEVLDWVEVAVGTTPSSLQGDVATSPIDASNSSQRILLETELKV